mmetsp:Transcript_146034/g.364147  ORF Transcript_146034/g.364147 Transcript_146034/m.364147 type:complete len:223 (-) Transcript_146034:1987-2655(-)
MRPHKAICWPGWNLSEGVGTSDSGGRAPVLPWKGIIVISCLVAGIANSPLLSGERPSSGVPGKAAQLPSTSGGGAVEETAAPPPYPTPNNSGANKALAGNAPAPATPGLARYTSRGSNCSGNTRGPASSAAIAPACAATEAKLRRSFLSKARSAALIETVPAPCNAFGLEAGSSRASGLKAVTASAGAIAETTARGNLLWMSLPSMRTTLYLPSSSSPTSTN